MSIEHRWSERKPIAMEVHLYHPSAGEVMARTRDVSLEGMFVETNATDLPVNTELEVAFTTFGKNGPEQHRVSAYVVHRNEAGVGLMLRHVEYSNFHALRYMLNAA
jgi:hypothetical protein